MTHEERLRKLAEVLDDLTLAYPNVRTKNIALAIYNLDNAIDALAYAKADEEVASDG